ncbi:hypothetical protein T08_1991 [Trichinella sp. T8]|nr:hypothetical protein T08_1991 [Trichinella sp. T8]
MKHPDILQIPETKKQLAGLFTQYQDSRQHLKLFPPAEIQKGHLFICLTLKESKIDAIARTIRIAIPFIYHNDVPDAKADSLQNL